MMKQDQREILEAVAASGGSVGIDTFKGRGYIVAAMVRKGWLEWERGRMPRSARATALFITLAGRDELNQQIGAEK